MQGEELRLLLFLGKKAGLSHSVRTSTSKIARYFQISQQTASRKLRSLAMQGLIELNATPSGCSVRLTGHGVHALKEQFVQLQQLFLERKAESLVGKLKVGLGEGAYYVSRGPYLQQFRRKLGFTPFPGTLNLIVDACELRSFLMDKEEILIGGFSTKERAFGPIKAFRAKVEGKQEAALIFPIRSSHNENEIEVIAAVNLRKKFRLREGSRVRITA